MKKLLYISSLPQNSQSGGANAVNYHTYRELQQHFECTYVQINPKESRWGKIRSQVMRKVLKRPGSFNFYSQKRLRQIAKEFHAIKGNYDIVFFRGFTPWILCQPQLPFFAYNDIHFLQFFTNTFKDNQFKPKDIQRICEAEKKWMSKAQLLFFESNWGAEQCLKDYQLNPAKLKAIGRGGHIPIPEKDQYDGSLNLMVIANNFYQKGGDLVVEAFKQLKSKYQELELHIIGGHPGDNVIAIEGVVYHGYLFKEKPEDLKQLVSIFSEAFLLMHITREDSNPLVPTEVGYFGCPCISVNHYAIPELILDKQTGILLDFLPRSDLITEAIETLILDETYYLSMRKAAWQFNHNTFSWDAIGDFLVEHINTFYNR